MQSLPGVTTGPGIGSQYVAFGLSGCEAAEYLRRTEPLAWALAALMNPGKLSRAELKAACLRRIAEARIVAGRDLLVECVETYLPLLTSEEVSEYAICDTGGGNRTMRVADMSIEQLYRAETRRWALRKGREEGARTVLLHLLAQKFGPVPASVQQRVEEIDSVARLTRLAERVLTAGSLEDLGLAPRSSDV